MFKSISKRFLQIKFHVKTNNVMYFSESSLNHVKILEPKIEKILNQTETLNLIIQGLNNKNLDMNQINNIAFYLDSLNISNENLLYKILYKIEENEFIKNEIILDKYFKKIEKLENDFPKFSLKFLFKLLQTYENCIKSRILENNFQMIQLLIESKIVKMNVYDLIDFLSFLNKNCENLFEKLIYEKKISSILCDHIQYFSLSMTIDLKTIFELINSLKNEQISKLKINIYNLIDSKLSNNKYKNDVLSKDEFNLLIEITEKFSGKSSLLIWNKLLDYIKNCSENSYPSWKFLIKLLSLNLRNKYDLDAQTFENIENYINKNISNEGNDIMYLMIYNYISGKSFLFYNQNVQTINNFILNKFNDICNEDFLNNENMILLLRFFNKIFSKLEETLKNKIIQILDNIIQKKLLSENKVLYTSLNITSNILLQYIRFISKTSKEIDLIIQIYSSIINIIIKEITFINKEGIQNLNFEKNYEIPTLQNLVDIIFLMKKRLENEENSEILKKTIRIQVPDYFLEQYLKKSLIMKNIEIITNPLEMIDFIILGERYKIKKFGEEIYNKLFPQFTKTLTLTTISNINEKCKENPNLHYLFHEAFLNRIKQAFDQKELDLCKIRYLSYSFNYFTHFLQDKRTEFLDHKYLHNMTEIFLLFQSSIFPNIIINFTQDEFKLNVFEKIDVEKNKIKEKKEKKTTEIDEEEFKYIFKQTISDNEMIHLLKIFENFQKMNIGSKLFYLIFKKFFLNVYDSSSYEIKIKWFYNLAESNRLNEEIINKAEEMVLKNDYNYTQEEIFQLLWFFGVTNNCNEEIYKKLYARINSDILNIDQEYLLKFHYLNHLFINEQKIKERMNMEIYINMIEKIKGLFKQIETRFYFDIENYLRKNYFEYKKDPIYYDNDIPVIQLGFELYQNNYILIVDRYCYLSNTKIEKGDSIIKRRLLSSMKTKFRVMEFYEWIKLQKRHEKNTYFKNKLKGITPKENPNKKEYYNY